MAFCQKCWRDATLRAELRGGTVISHYRDLLRERESNPCPPETEEKKDEDDLCAREEAKRGNSPRLAL